MCFGLTLSDAKCPSFSFCTSSLPAKATSAEGARFSGVEFVHFLTTFCISSCSRQIFAGIVRRNERALLVFDNQSIDAFVLRFPPFLHSYDESYKRGDKKAN